jgi:hypothetical protein
LRKLLINNKPHICILCHKNLPLSLLETAHLKPRCILNYNEKNDDNIVEFMCRFCHKLYDDGYLGIIDGLLNISDIIKNNKDLHYETYKPIKSYNSQNKKYFIYHYENIYNKFKE